MSIPYGGTHALRNVHAAAVVVILAVGTASVSIEYLSALIMAYWLPSLVMAGGPKISTTTTLTVSSWEKVDGACA